MTALLTKKQVATFLAVTTKTINKYCREGKLAFIQLPAGKRFRQADVDDFIKGREFNHQP